MRELVTTMNQRGQVTIPAEVRRLLGLNAHDKVAFIIDEGEVRIVPVSFTVASAFGSVKPIRQSSDFDEQIRDAKEERAERMNPPELYSYDSGCHRVDEVKRIVPI